jgi:phage terminase large subunit
MSLNALKRQVDDLYARYQAAPEIILEPDTSLTFLYGNDRKEWNLPNSFLKFRWYQENVHKALFQDHYRFIYLAWSRRLGKEVTMWSAILKYCFLHRCTGVVVYPDSKMGSRILWEGKMTNKENQSSIDFLSFLPPFVDRNKDINDTVKRIDLPNGSQIWLLGAENFDKLRGINPQIVGLSEYAFQDPRAYEALRPIVAENGGVLLVQTTFDGNNHGYKLYENVKNNPDWFCSFLTAATAKNLNGERYITEEEIDKMRREKIMPEHKIQQEFYMDVGGDSDRYVFGATLKDMQKLNCFQENVWKSGYPIYTFWDIGIKDANFIILVQFIHEKPHIVMYFETQNQTYEKEIDAVTQWRTLRNLSLGKHFLPHDGKNRNKQTRGEIPESSHEYIASKLGEPAESLDKPPSKAYGNQLVRNILPSCVIDKTTCGRLIECLEQHKKEWNQDKQCYTDAGIHDWTSHAVSAVQTLALAIERNRIFSTASAPKSYRKKTERR